MRAALLCLLLSGCVTTGTNIPVGVSCVKEAPEKPQTTAEADLLKMDDYSATMQTWLERLLLKSYAEKAEAVINACR